MKIEQQVRSDAKTQDAYTGEEGQLTLDTDNWDVRLHDGVTPGGRKIINRDNGDERWQAKSVELDGFDFAASARGMVVRLSAGNYKIRKLTVNLNQLTLDNPDGYGGNPKIGLAERIETPHIFGDDIIIEGVLEVEGGINGDTSGTHYGNVEGNVLGNLAGDSSGTHTGPTNGAHTGDVDVRGANLLLDDGQIAPSKVNGIDAYIYSKAWRTGFIQMWSGAVADIPSGWFLCNGLNGTPDLTDRFIIGAGGITFDPGDTGGATTHSHGTSIEEAGSHTHTVTVDGHALTESEIPAHKHGNGVTDVTPSLIFTHGELAATSGDSIDNDGNSGNVEGYTSTVGGGAAHSHTASSGSAGTHTHTINNPSASSYPPYYALCFIMRVVA